MRVVNIQRMSLDDGPGIRTTVFAKGCPLRCRWCHNPECISLQESPEFLQSFPDSFVFDGNVEAFCDLICRDMDFFRKSGGGITFSGGEPLMHADIIAECMANVKGRGCHTALDTCGLADWRAFEKVLDLTDLVLFDPGTVAEQCTYTEPLKQNIGIEKVFVNGKLALEGGKVTGVRAGRVLRRGRK